MKRRKKIVNIELNLEDWWTLSRCAANKKMSIRQFVKQELKPIINDGKKKFPYEDLGNPDSSKGNAKVTG